MPGKNTRQTRRRKTATAKTPSKAGTTTKKTSTKTTSKSTKSKSKATPKRGTGKTITSSPGEVKVYATNAIITKVKRREAAAQRKAKAAKKTETKPTRKLSPSAVVEQGAMMPKKKTATKRRNIRTEKGKTGPKRSEADKERDKLVIADLHLQGFSYRMIADELNGRKGVQYKISHETVRTEFNAIRQEWKARTMLKYDEHIVEMVAQLDLAIREAWKAYMKSTEPEVVTTYYYKGLRKRKKVKEEDLDDYREEERKGNIKKISKSVRTRFGSPSLLLTVKSLIKDKATLLAANLPSVNNGGGEGGVGYVPPVNPALVESLSERQIAKIVHGEDAGFIDFENMDTEDAEIIK